MNLFAFLMAAAPAAEGQQANPIVGLLPIFLVFVVFYFFMIRPEKKKNKQITEMRDSLRVGDEVVTIGGIIGKITNVNGDQITLETGADRSKVKMMRWAIGSKTEKEEVSAEVEAE